jgi:hypothetical protein
VHRKLNCIFPIYNVNTARQTVAGLMNSNPYALTRVLFGKTLLNFPGLLKNSRAGPNGISDDVFNKYILPAVHPNLFTSWSWFYSKGKDGIRQMEYQLDLFRNVDFPVLVRNTNTIITIKTRFLNITSYFHVRIDMIYRCYKGIVTWGNQIICSMAVQRWYRCFFIALYICLIYHNLPSPCRRRIGNC